MKVLLWLMIPVAALILGIIWASLRSRPPRPAAMQDSMASFSRFRHALANNPASSGRRRPEQVSTSLVRGAPGSMGADDPPE
jgi:hypothetical protein